MKFALFHILPADGAKRVLREPAHQFNVLGDALEKPLVRLCGFLPGAEGGEKDEWHRRRPPYTHLAPAG